MPQFCIFDPCVTRPPEWLDNDGDGCVDNPTVLAKMTSAQAGSGLREAVVVPGAEGSWGQAVAEQLVAAGLTTSAPLYTAEVLPACAGTAATSSCADATLEEVSGGY